MAYSHRRGIRMKYNSYKHNYPQAYDKVYYITKF